MSYAGHVAQIVEIRNAYCLGMGTPEGRRPLIRRRQRWVDNIKMDQGETGWGGLHWVGLFKNRDQ
jgi:hypothetical protein